MNVVRNSLSAFDADKLFPGNSRLSVGGSTANALAVDFEGI